MVILEIIFVLSIHCASASYLSNSSLSFAGYFETKTATLNNFIRNFDPANQFNMTPWWCPDGLNSFSLNAPTLETKLGNADLGCLKQSSFSLSNAFLVDLDPDQQFVAALFGDNTVTLGEDASHPAMTARLANDFPLFGVWTIAQRARSTPQPIAAITTRQSGHLVASLENVKWNASALACSPALRRLHDEWERTSRVLAVRLAMDNFDSNNQSATYGRGDVSVQLGTGESATHVQPTRAAAPLVEHLVGPQLAFELDSTLLQLRVDMAVGVAKISPGGAAVFEQLRFGVMRTKSSSSVVHWLHAGLVNVTRTAMRQTNDVAVVPLSHAELQILRRAPLVIATADRAEILAQEHADGRVLHVHPRVVRLRTSSSKQSITVKTFQFGEPTSERVVVRVAPSPMPHARYNNSPFNGARLPSSKFRTNTTGVAVMPLVTHPVALNELPLVRRPLRSQLYFHQLCPINQKPSNASCSLISSKIWAEPPKLNGTVTWADVGPLFKQYAWLYPGMNAIVDMSTPQGLTRSAQGVASLMALDFYSRMFMPITRDLDLVMQQRMVDYVKSLINKH